MEPAPEQNTHTQNELGRTVSASLPILPQPEQAAAFNPFLNRTPNPTVVDWLKMILLLPLALVRVDLVANA